MKIGEILVSKGKVSARDIERALVAQEEMGGLIGQVLLKLGLVSEQDLLESLSQQLDIAIVKPDEYPQEPLKLDEVSIDFISNNNVVLLKSSAEELTFSAATPHNPYIKKALELATGKRVVLRLGAETDINKVLEQIRHQEAAGAEQDAPADVDGEDFIEHLKDLASEAPVIRDRKSVV